LRSCRLRHTIAKQTPQELWHRMVLQLTQERRVVLASSMPYLVLIIWFAAVLNLQATTPQQDRPLSAL
jgi:hypothetical protein